MKEIGYKGAKIIITGVNVKTVGYRRHKSYRQSWPMRFNYRIVDIMKEPSEKLYTRLRAAFKAARREIDRLNSS